MTATPETEPAVSVDTEAELLPVTDEQPEFSDEDINAAIQAEFAKRPTPTAPRRASIQEIFGQSVSLIASATGKTFRNGVPTVSEPTALKVIELSMMWALNSRDGAAAPILDPVPGETDEAADGDETPLIPAEIIGAAPDEA